MADTVHSQTVSVLLHPSVVPVVDIFRQFSRLEDHYDLAVLDQAERDLTPRTGADVARAVVSDALLLAFAMNRQRSRSLRHNPLKSRHGTRDEYCLLVLIGARRSAERELADEAAAALSLDSLDAIASLIDELAHQAELGSLAVEAPSLADFRAVAGSGDNLRDPVERLLERQDFQFRF